MLKFGSAGAGEEAGAKGTRPSQRKHHPQHYPLGQTVRRVLLDGRKLGDGGIGRNLSTLVDGYLKAGSVEIGIIVRPDQVLPPHWAGRVTCVVDKAKRYSLDEFVGMPRRIDFSGYDLFHVPHYTLPYGIPIPTVVSVHDLIHVHHPERWYYPWVSSTLIRSALRRAARVVTVSEATKRELIWLFKSDEIARKIRVVPNAVASSFLNPSDERLLDQFNVSKCSFLLAVFSNAKAHKGAHDLITAFDHAVSAAEQSGYVDKGLSLVLAGHGARNLGRHPLVRRLRDSQRVHVLGEVNEDELVCLYRHARGVVVPSFAEGFCLPVLEAHAVGCPVVARPVPAVRELLTEDDVCCLGFSRSALTEGILELLRRPVLRGSSAKDRFTAPESPYLAEAVAREMLEVYEEAVRS